MPTIPAPAATTPPTRNCLRRDTTRSAIPARPLPARKPAGRSTIPASARAAATPPIRSLTRWDMPMKPARFSPPARRRGIPCTPASAARIAIPTPSFPATVICTANGRRMAMPPAAPTVSETAVGIRKRLSVSRLSAACCSRTRRLMISRSVPSAARSAMAHD